MSEQQSLVEVKSGLPAELLNRFDAFLVEAKERVPAAQEALVTAKEFVIDSDAAFLVADTAQSKLKAEAKALSEKRLGLTREIDDFKNTFVMAEKEAVGPLHEGANEYQLKMSAYRRKIEEAAKQAQLAAEQEIAKRKAADEAAARKLDEKAANLKTEAARQKAIAEAALIRQVSAMTPTSVALSAPAPPTVASNVAEIWELEKVEDISEFLKWLVDHPEWHGVLNFQRGEMNRMAKQFRDVVLVPGVKFHKRDSFRSKPRG